MERARQVPPCAGLAMFGLRATAITDLLDQDPYRSQQPRVDPPPFLCVTKDEALVPEPSGDGDDGSVLEL